MLFIFIITLGMMIIVGTLGMEIIADHCRPKLEIKPILEIPDPSEYKAYGWMEPDKASAESWRLK